jgi:hypothetical protein
MNEAQLISAALKLPVRKRERVAEALMLAVKLPSQGHIDRLWAQEAESRVDGFLSGKIKKVSGEKVLAYRSGK